MTKTISFLILLNLFNLDFYEPQVNPISIDTSISYQVIPDFAPRGLVYEVIDLREEIRNLKDRVTQLELKLQEKDFKYPNYQNQFKSQK